MRLTIKGGEWIDALQFAAEVAEARVQNIVKVTTERVRIIAQPERITGKNGDRIFGAERLHPATVGWTVKRTFTLA